jgi:uncharacterized protein (DUF58 family)
LKTSYLFLAFVFLTVLLFLTSFFYGDAMFALVALVIPVAAAFAKSSFSAELKALRIDANRKALEPLAFQGRPISIILEVQNLGPKQSLMIEDILPEYVELVDGSNKVNIVLGRGEKIVQKYSIRPLKRGYLTLEEVRVTIQDRTGFFLSDISIPEETEIVVHVKEESLIRGVSLAKRERLEVTHFSEQRWLRTRDFEFDGIRDYVPGDKFRDIHWKSLSKLQKLLTKYYRMEAMIPTIILLDCSRSMRMTKTDTAKVDHGVHLSLEIAKILLSGHHQTGIVLFDEIGVIGMQPPSERNTQFDRILSVLRNVPPHISEMPAEGAAPKAVPEEKIEQEKPSGDIEEHEVDEEAEPFLSTVARFASLKGLMQTKVGLEGIVRADFSRGQGRSQMYILITDMEASRDSILKSATAALANRHKMVLATPFSFWYSRVEGKETTVDELEEAYSQYSEKLESERFLKRMGVIVVDIGPRDEAFKITRAIRRRFS